MASRKADAVLFGFDFQVNAAIVIMLEHIKNVASLRLESNNEDIEIELDNGKFILAQAKSIVKSSTDFSNVRGNLKKALTSLSEGSHRVAVDKLILITNSPNPLNEQNSRSIFWGTAHRDFDSLPASSQSIINNYLEKISDPLDTSKFLVQVLPFETDNEHERYKAVTQAVDDFVGELNLSTPGLGKRLHEIWRLDIFTNGSKRDASINLTKKSIIWPIIVLETDIDNMDDDFYDEFDSGLYDEIVHQYKATIDSRCERYEFFTKVLYDYNEYGHGMKQKEKSSAFVNEKWKDYSTEFEVSGISSDIVESLTKVVLHNIIRRRYMIERIKKGANL